MVYITQNALNPCHYTFEWLSFFCNKYRGDYLCVQILVFIEDNFLGMEYQKWYYVSKGTSTFKPTGTSHQFRNPRL